MALSNGSQFYLGVTIHEHRGRKIPVSIGTPSYDSVVSDMENFQEVDVGYIPAGFEHRPDLISNLFYGSASYWWLILLINNIADPFEGLNVGDRILLPKI